MSSILRGRISALSKLSFLALLAVTANLVGYSEANPYMYTGEIPPDQETYPPLITISSPANNTAYSTSRVPLTFNVTAPQSRTASSTTIIKVTYADDWRKEAIHVLDGGHEQASFNLWLSNVPEGQHSIIIKAVGYGLYEQEQPWTYKVFNVRSTATIYFTTDRTLPTISFLPLENLSSTSIVPFNFTVNEAYSKITYSLNGQPNITVSGNSTIPPLLAGQYNVTAYAWDIAGNVGTSDTAIFTVLEPPETQKTADDSLLLPTTVAMLTVVIISTILLLKRRAKSSLALNL